MEKTITVTMNQSAYEALTAGMETQANEIMDIKEAAQLTHFSVPTLYTYVCRRKVPYLKRTGRILFDRAELLAWLRSSRVATIDEIKTAVNQ
jgi:predicted DNA-binding transcriptional regulator AlpA